MKITAKQLAEACADDAFDAGIKIERGSRTAWWRRGTGEASDLRGRRLST